MSRTHAFTVLVLFVGSLSAPDSGLAPPQNAPRYSLVVLPTLGGSSSKAWDINDAGVAVGSADTRSGDVHAFLWRRGKLKDLGVLSGYRSSYAMRINRRSEVVGRLTSHGRIVELPRAFLYRKPRLHDLGRKLGVTHSEASDINDRGQVAGTLFLSFSETERGGVRGRAFLWSAGRLDRLETLGGDTNSAEAVSATGEVVGFSELEPGKQTRHAFLYSKGQVRDLGTLGGESSFAGDINDRGVIVGGSNLGNGESRAFRWSGGKMRDLGTLQGNRDTSAEAINNQGLIVGSSSDSKSSRAFLYSAGRMQDLNHLVQAGGGWVIRGAHGINDRGRIAGNASKEGEIRGCVLTPRP